MKNYLGLLFFILGTWNLSAQDVGRGQFLFNQNCSLCHSGNMKGVLVGPALGSVGQRWEAYPIEDLFAFIKDVPSMIMAGHKKALEIDDASGLHFKMPAFPDLSDDDVALILNYVNNTYEKTLKKEKEEEKMKNEHQDTSAFGKGKVLYRDYCAACHHHNMVDRVIGPGLGGIENCWADYPKEDLYNFIRNPQQMIESGHKKANEIWGNYKPMFMPSFPSLTDTEIKDILLYIDVIYNRKKKQ